MCGIAGLFNLDPAVIGKAQRDVVLRAMTDAIAHRGPDGSGLWHDDRARCSLGHRRLSIIDTSDAGLQPMMSADGRWIISFNGEIYNFKSLRSDLAAQGAVFHGRTDTEVLLQALAYWGVEAWGL
jgi:asparagine synthetase B (glutamine-hydrolysing)